MAILLRDPARSWESLYLSAASVFVSLLLLNDLWVAIGAYANAPDVFGWAYATTLGIGPAVWLHVAAVADPVDAGWRRARPHVVGLAVALVALAPYALLTGAERWQVETGVETFAPSRAPTLSLAMWLVAAVTYLQPAFYLVWSFRRARGVTSPARRRWTVALLTAAAILWGGTVLNLPLSMMGVDTAAMLAVEDALVAIALYGLALLAVASPPDRLEALGPQSVSQAKYAKSAMNDTDAARLVAKLAAANRERKYCRDSALTLRVLADAISASPNDVSQALNMKSGGYHDWVSRERVLDAQEMLLKESGLGLLDAAFAAGFNSKSTFYEAFRRIEGVTPRQWRAGATHSSPGAGGIASKA